MTDTEALLFVDDEQTQVLKLEALREDRVRANEDVDLAVSNALEDLLALLGRAKARDHLDGDREVGEAPFEAYLLRGSGSVAQFSIDWKDVAESKGDYYFRWVMTLKLKRDGKSKPPTLTCGISQVRFGADGKVVFQQDYYDAGAFLYEKLPILGSEIRYIKKKL